MRRSLFQPHAYILIPAPYPIYPECVHPYSNAYIIIPAQCVHPYSSPIYPNTYILIPPPCPLPHIPEMRTSLFQSTMHPKCTRHYSNAYILILALPPCTLNAYILIPPHHIPARKVCSVNPYSSPLPHVPKHFCVSCEKPSVNPCSTPHIP